MWLAYGVGNGQTWQNLTSSRALRGTYTNTTGKPIQVSVHGVSSDTTYMGIWVNGWGVERVYCVANQYCSVSAIIPSGNTYVAQFNSGVQALSFWSELR